MKWHHQPTHRSESWLDSIEQARQAIDEVIEDHPSLADYPQAWLPKAYQRARRQAARETKRLLMTVPDHCPWDLDDIRREGWLPPETKRMAVAPERLSRPWPLRPRRRHRRVRRIFVWALIVVAVLAVGWAVDRDIEDQPAPLEANALWYALSTVAQVAAALAALIGFFGLWRLDQLRERVHYHRQRQRDIERERGRFWQREDRKIIEELNAGRVTSPEEVDQRFNHSRTEDQRRLEPWLAIQHKAEEASQGMQRQLQTALKRFLLGTLALLVLAIVSLVFLDALCAWPWTARLLIILAGLSLGIGPALVIREAL